jgi:hypothetical protein
MYSFGETKEPKKKNQASLARGGADLETHPRPGAYLLTKYFRLKWVQNVGHFVFLWGI